MPRNALGSGLGLAALLPPKREEGNLPLPLVAVGTTTSTGTAEISGPLQKPFEIEIAKIVPNPYQPRMTFDQKGLETLAQSIKSHGLMQPIVVRSRPDGKMELIAGERRLRAATLAGLVKIPVIIKETDNNGMMEYALLENLQREDLNPIEKAQAYSRLLTEFSLTQEAISEKMGMDRSSVANTLRLLHLPKPLWKDLADGSINMGHAKVLLSLETPALQLQMAQQIKSKGLSVRQLEKQVKSISQKTKSAKSSNGKYPSEIRDLENQLLHALGTKVHLIPSGTGKGGEIRIVYYSLDDLDRILEKLTGVTTPAVRT